MQLLAPTVFIALIPLAAIIILLYLLKLRRVPVEIASTFLWRQALQDVQANVPFQKLKRNLLLLLQLLALTAIVAGLAAPYVLAERLGGRNTVIVVDASGSMRATDVEGSRFEQARIWARRIITSMGRNDEIAIIVSEARSHVAAPFTGDQRKLLQTVAALQPTDCQTNIKDGLLLAMSLAAKRPNAQVYVVSDGAFEALPDVSGSSNVRFLKVGERNDNVAILAFEASRPAGAEEHQLFLRIRNFSMTVQSGLLTLHHDDDIIDAEQISLKPGEDKVQAFSLLLHETGMLRAEIEIEDDLATDNVAYAFAETKGKVSVLLVTPGNLFLEQALLILPEVSVDRTELLDADTAATIADDYDLVVFDRVDPPTDMPAMSMMVIREGGAGADRLQSPEISRWENTHPVLAHVNLNAVEIASGRAVAREPGTEVLAWSGDAPIIVARDAPGMRRVSFGFNFLDSDLPLRVGFPVLLSNCVEWLAETSTGIGQSAVRPGDPLRFRAPLSVDRVSVTTPAGDRQQVALVDRQAAFTGTDRVGVYVVQAGERRWRAAVDMRSSTESDLTPKDELQLGARRVQGMATPPRVEHHLWPYIILAALLILLGEWYLYHRRY
jgi:hypothetical protein